MTTPPRATDPVPARGPDPGPGSGSTGFAVIVPVKPLAVAKSRLADVSGVQRRDLARSFALDTITAVLGTAMVDRVLVATDDATFSRDLVALGCESMPDGDSSDLNAALLQAVAEARRRWPRLQPVALLADLPALRPPDLAAALVSTPWGAAAFVADSVGTGTTLYTAPYDDFAPRFGAGSCAAHRASGAVEIPGRLDSLRCDVDDLDDLRAALRLGVGANTARVTTRWRDRDG